MAQKCAAATRHWRGLGTAANVNEVTQAHALLHGEESDVFSDAAGGSSPRWPTLELQRQLRSLLGHEQIVTQAYERHLLIKRLDDEVIFQPTSVGTRSL
ncbi:hypothetical protein [Cupriavidus necator]